MLIELRLKKYKFMIVNSQDDIDTELLDNYDMSDLNHESIENYRKLLLKILMMRDMRI